MDQKTFLDEYCIYRTNHIAGLPDALVLLTVTEDDRALHGEYFIFVLDSNKTFLKNPDEMSFSKDDIQVMPDCLKGLAEARLSQHLEVGGLFLQTKLEQGLKELHNTNFYPKALACIRQKSKSKALRDKLEALSKLFS